MVRAEKNPLLEDKLDSWHHASVKMSKYEITKINFINIFIIYFEHKNRKLN